MGEKKQPLITLLVINILLILVNNFVKYHFQPVAIVVPHHNIVQEKRLEFFTKIAKERVATKSIIILSPNHFSSSQFKISYSDRNWELSNGNLEFDNDLGLKIVNGLAKENGLLVNDHGIYNLLPDIKKVWSKAKIVPLLIGQKVELSKLGSLVLAINKNCGGDCLLIASVDFSHYLPRALADIHDLNNYEALNNLEITEDQKIEVDSLQSLYLSTDFAKNNGSRFFHLFSHTNSGWMLNNRDLETTSYFFGWFQKDFLGKAESFNTFLVGINLDEKEEAKGLGERFYYGVDNYIGCLETVYQPDEKIKIIPVQTASSIEQTENSLNIYLGSDFVVSGYQAKSKRGLVFLPIKKEKKVNLLLRGAEKNEYYEKFFKTVNSNRFFKIDKEEGIILY